MSPSPVLAICSALRVSTGSGLAVRDSCKGSAGGGGLIGVLRETADSGGAGAGSATGGSGIAADAVRSIDSGCG